MPTRLRSLAAISFAFCVATFAADAEKKPLNVEIKKQDGKLRIEIGGEHFTDYIYEGYSRPILYPLLGPGGVRLTRDWPLKEGTPDEEHDHPHHKSFFWAHGDMNGVDFWAEGKDSGKTVHQAFTEIKSGAVGIIRSQNKYVSAEGKDICTDDRTLRIYGDTNPRILDFEVSLHAVEGNLTLGDTKEGTLALRLNETMRLKGKVGKGHIINSEGVRDDETWGKRAKWVDYFGPAEGKLVGVAIFDHPKNPRFPTYWHVRDYGLFAANPFGVHDFEKKPPGTGAMIIPEGVTMTWRYRIYIHTGDDQEGKVAAAYADYITAPTEGKK
jgi:hypothetical protein